MWSVKKVNKRLNLKLRRWFRTEPLGRWAWREVSVSGTCGERCWGKKMTLTTVGCSWYVKRRELEHRCSPATAACPHAKFARLRAIPRHFCTQTRTLCYATTHWERRSHLADKQTRRFSHARRRLSPSSRHLPYCAFADSHLTADARSQTNRLLSPARVSRYPCPIHCSLPPFPSPHPAWSIAHALFIAPLSVVVLIIEFLFLFFSGVFSAWISVIDSGTVWWKSAITPLGWIIYIYEKKCFFM